MVSLRVVPLCSFYLGTEYRDGESALTNTVFVAGSEESVQCV